jgi:hypothetical protein
MADFALWATAGESELGWKNGTFMKAYSESRAEANEVALDASPIVAPLRSLANGEGWKGTCTELLSKLIQMAGLVVVRTKQWPKNARTLSGILRRLAPNLRKSGIAVELWREPGGNRERRVSVTAIPIDKRVEPRGERKLRPDRPNASHDRENARALRPELNGPASPLGSGASLPGTQGDGRDANFPTLTPEDVTLSKGDDTAAVPHTSASGDGNVQKNTLEWI